MVTSRGKSDLLFMRYRAGGRLAAALDLLSNGF